MTKGWTEERRRKQAEAIRRWQPWKKSTGPRTREGKETSSLNALKHGDRSRALAPYYHALAINRAFLKAVAVAMATDGKTKKAKELLARKRRMQ